MAKHAPPRTHGRHAGAGQNAIRRAGSQPQRESTGARTSSAPPGTLWIHGYQAVAGALANPARKILRVVGTTEALAKLQQEPAVLPEAIKRAHAAARRDIDALVGEDA